MGIKDLKPQTPPERGFGPPDDQFDWEQSLAAVFPHGASKRLGRALGVNPRVAQKWAAGTEPPSDRARAFVYSQDTLVTKAGLTAVLERLVQHWYDAGIHEEAIASQLAKMHERIVDKQVE